MKRTYSLYLAAGIIFLVLASIFTPGCQSKKSVQTSKGNEISLDSLKRGFATPPASVKPFTWWHWINGNITREGITKDLEWMKAYGIGGAIVFNVGMLGDDVPRKVKFGTDEWWKMADHAIAEADRLGLKIGFHNCDGWSHSGGPWMDVDNSMKKMVWTEKFVRSGDKNIVLEKPEVIMDYYKEIAVLAFPVSDQNPEVVPESVASNFPGFNSLSFSDKSAGTTIDLHNIDSQNPVYFDFQFSRPQNIAAVTLHTAGNRLIGFNISVEISDDGLKFQPVKAFVSRSRGILGWKTLDNDGTFSFSFPAQKTKYVRVKFMESEEFKLSGISLYETERMDEWEMKAAQIQYTEHGGAAEYYIPDEKRWKQNPSTDAINEASILDLTDKLGKDNRLDWSPEKGNWRILRIGQTTLGKMNGPSTVEGRGLEADKLNPLSLDKHYNGFLKKMVDRNINKETNSFKYSEIDSWEAGIQNWTNGFLEVFKNLNGYDMKPFLPVLTGGYIVGNYEISERFLWDFRETLSHLIQNGCFNHMAQLAHKDSLKVFAEGSGRQQYLYNPINYQSTADIPKGEFWRQRYTQG